ncbi:MAG TPA: lysophospholipid acyltransferase family protein, partial [Thermoleophilaceae bacterium]|nr:lysophospholipid acyltransferase family protein [Thermoleophilaceae bacterium]
MLERLAGPPRDGGGGGTARTPARWRTGRTGPDPWSPAAEVADQPWLRGRRASLAREGLQQSLLFPLTRFVTSPKVSGADDLLPAPQPAVIAPNHSSDVDTPLVLWALPRVWRMRTVVGAASDRFYASRRTALTASLWINTFPFDRGSEGHGLAAAAEHLRGGYNVLIYPQATRTSGLEGMRGGVGRLCVATGTPAVPVHVTGTGLLMPKGRGVTRRGRTEVRFGRAVEPLAGEEPQEFTERVGAAIGALAGAA